MGKWARGTLAGLQPRSRSGHIADAAGRCRERPARPRGPGSASRIRFSLRQVGNMHGRRIIIRARKGGARAGALALLLVASSPWAAPARAQTDFGVDDAIDLVRVSNPRMSPDGTRVLFSRSELDWEENERVASLWIVNADGTDARRFTGEDDDSGARWSPDGRWVAFLRADGDEDRTRQIFVIRTDGGEARALTDHPASVRSFQWGDANSIFFVADDSLPDEEEKRREDGYDAVFVDEAPNGQARGEWSSIWRIALEAKDSEGAQARRLTAGTLRIGQFAVAPGGGRVAYTYRHENRRNDGYLSEIALMDAATGETRDLTDNEAPESSLAWSPDGTRISFVAPDLESWELDQGNLYVMEVESGEVREVAPGITVDIRGTPAWHPSGDAFHFAGLERTVANLYRLGVDSGEPEAVSSSNGVLSSPSFSADFTRYAFVESTPASPGDVFAAEVGAGPPTRLTRANPWMEERRLAEPEVVRWRSRDGLPVEGLLYRSRKPGARSLVLEIHGGPAGVFTRGFDADAQILAAAGYSVIQPNVRGSSGYGDELLRGNMNDIGGGDYDDVMTGVDHALGAGVAHPDSLAVKGWSYGGILGGWTITRTDRFKAASLGAMVSDWRSEFGTGFHFDVLRWYLGGDPWSNRSHWLERSAYSHLDRVSTPTILFHGERDRTDTMAQSMNFFAGLTHFGVESRFVLFPREGHGISEPRHHRTRLVEELRWLELHVRGNADWEAPERPEEEAKPRPATDFE